MSPSIIEIFVSDAGKYLGRLRDATDPALDGADAETIRRSARRLQHSASLAHQEAILDACTALQKTAVQIIAGKRDWTADLRDDIRAVLSEMETVVGWLPDGDSGAEARLRSAVEVLTAPSAGEEAEVATPAAEPVEGSDDEADAVLATLIHELEDAVERLENDPRDREPLKSMLRRIRRLRDLGRIEPVSAPDKALTAVEELILQIADLNATVGPGYLTVFRHAREVMLSLQAGEVDGGGGVRRGAVDMDELKDKVMETARRARQVVWVSDLFYEEGAPIVTCPVAEEKAGSQERYFLTEATQRLDRSEALRKTMLESDAEQMRLAGESLAHTLRHLRERAVAFNHASMGRVVRRAAAALRAQLVRPPSRVRSLANGFGGVFSSLRVYLDSSESVDRELALTDAEAALHGAIAGDEQEMPAEEEGFDPDRALQQALALRARIDERLKALTGPEAQGLKQDLEELFDLIAYYVSESGGPN